MKDNRMLLIGKISNNIKTESYNASLISIPKDLADFHKDFLKFCKEFKAIIVEQTLTSCKAQIGELTLSYGPEDNADSLGWDYDKALWDSYKTKNKAKVKK